MANLEPDLFTRTVGVLAPHMATVEDREQLLLPVLSTWKGRRYITWEGNAAAFTARLVDLLPPELLEAVLYSVTQVTGEVGQREISHLVQDINATTGSSHDSALSGIHTQPLPGLSLDDFESVLFCRAGSALGYRSGEPQALDDVVYAWRSGSKAGEPLVLVLDFRPDVQQTLLAVSRDEQNTAWIDGGALLGRRSTGRYDTVSNGARIGDLGPSLILVDFSTIPLERVLGRGTDEDGEEDADARVAGFLAWARSNGHSVVLGLPRYVLRRLSLRLLRSQSTWVYTPAALYARGYERRAEPCAKLLGDKSPLSKVLLPLLAANSSSLSRVSASILTGLIKGRVPWDILNEDSLAFVLEFADRLVAEGFYEVAYRLEGYCRTARSQNRLIYLGADLYFETQNRDNQVVGFLPSVVEVPTALSYGALTGEAGAGKTTALLQIEHHWMMPRVADQGIDYPSYLPIYIPCRREPAFSLDGLILSVLRQVDHHVIESKNRRFRLPCHSLISRLDSPEDLFLVFSSPVLLLLDDVDQLIPDDQEQLSSALDRLRSDFPALGILLSFRQGEVFPFAGLNQAGMREMDEAQVESLVAQSTGQASLSDLLASSYHSVSGYLRNPYLLAAICELGLSDKDLLHLSLHDIVGRHIAYRSKGITDEISAHAVQEWLPAVAFGLRFHDAIPAASANPHDQQMLLAGRRMGLIKEGGDVPQFQYGLVMDYFVARQMERTIQESGLDQFLQWYGGVQHERGSDSLSVSLKNVFKILVGFLDDRDTSKFIEFLQRRVDVRLAHECVLELPEKKIFSHLGPSKLLAGRITRYDDLDLEDRVEDARILGHLDPRIVVNEPRRNLVPVNSSDRLDPFMIGRYSVTNMEYAGFVNAGGYLDEQYWSPAGWQWLRENNIFFPRYWRNNRLNRPNWPVVGVSYYEGCAYCKWLSESGDEYALPTAAEWDLAAYGTEGFNEKLLNFARRTVYGEPAGRHGQGTRKSMGLRNRLKSWLTGSEAPRDADLVPSELDPEELDALAIELLEAAEGYMETYRRQLERGLVTPVGLFQANGAGCYDLFGNVWEWCDTSVSPMEEFSQDMGDNAAVGEGESMVVKGGSTLARYDPIWLLIGGWFDPHVQFHRLGFRVICRSG